MLEIPVIYIKDKQAFKKKDGFTRFIGKPIDVAKKLKDKYKLIHFVDVDAINGSNNNLDIYNSLTFFINIQVECSPKPEIIRKLLSIKCRVVLQPDADVSEVDEKNLLVCMVPKDYRGNADGFKDVIVSNSQVAKFEKLGKRVILDESESASEAKKETKTPKAKLWGKLVFDF